MTSELTILALYGLLVVVILFVHVLLAVPELGIPYLVGPRDEARTLTGVAGRAERAASNSLLAMALFAPAVLILAAKGGFSGGSLLAAQVFLVARVIYWPLYLAGIPWLRTLSWLVGFLATAWLYILALGPGAAM